MDKPICVQSEVGRLRTVMLHRPGKELENLMPDYLSRQLFDDIPYLVHAREEHDQFAKTLRDCAVCLISRISSAPMNITSCSPTIFPPRTAWMPIS